ncbi:MAG: poly-gamma-glutamate system protein [Candidatus Eisenbacteria sp.]|nr:poly-gamma-glutamate system protein [Candidatus Eisenbacteria bacterium]
MAYGIDVKKKIMIAILAVAAIGAEVILEGTKIQKEGRYYELKSEATTLAAQGFEVLRKYRLTESAVLDLVNDPAGTGLIGPEHSLITNARGVLTAKLTSLNPNFAAIIVEYFGDAGLKNGDAVGLGASGSFPGVNICVYAAMQAMGLHPIPITSVGASNWGANDPAFTWLDMERVLEEEGVFQFHSAAASPGGTNDMGRGLSPEGRRLIWEAIDRNHIQTLSSDNIEESIAKRMQIYESEAGEKGIKAYVNIGGGIASLGSAQNRALIPTGLSTDLGLRNFPRKGVIIQMALSGVPVIHLNQISDIALSHGLPVAPEYMPEVGEGEIFSKEAYNIWVTAGLLVAYLILTFAFITPGFRRRILGQKSPSPSAAG